MRLLHSAAKVGGLTLVSRVLGFVRDAMMAAAFGASPAADAFFVAFKLPNLFRRLFAEGAFNAAFVPLFARRLEEQGLKAARRFAERALSVLLAGLIAATLAAEISMPAIVRVLAPGFVRDAQTFDLAVLYGRITFPYLLLLSLTALLGGALNALYRYGAPAAAPIMLNLVLIGALAVAVPALGHAGPARVGIVLAWAVFAAGIVQFLWLALACRRAGLTLRLPRPRLGQDIRRLFVLLGPAAGSAGVIQINLLIGNMIASHRPGAVSHLYYADRLYQLPLGMVGIAIGVVLLPELARRLRAGDAAAALAVQGQAIEFAMALALPAAAALLAIAGPLVSVLFQRGAFGPDSARATASVLAAFACGLPAFVTVKLLSPGFFAREDTATPLKCAAAAVAVNIGASLLLFPRIGAVGIAAATSLAAWVNAGLLAAILERRRQLGLTPRLKRGLPRLAVAALSMAALLGLAAEPMGAIWAGSMGFRLAALAALVIGGLVAYLALALAIGALDLAEVRGLLRRRSPA